MLRYFFNTKGFNAKQEIAFYSLDTFFFLFHLRRGESGFIFKRFCFFSPIKLFLCNREDMSFVNSVDGLSFSLLVYSPVVSLYCVG